jgi:HEAT repeat protein
VLEAASSNDEPTRLIALSSLVNFRSPKVVEALAVAACDVSDQVQAAAIGFLAARSEAEATEVLVDHLLLERSGNRSRAALLVPNVARVAGLLRALEHAGEELAAAITSLLVRINRPEARTALYSAARSKNVGARKAALSSIAAGPRHPDKTALLEYAAANDSDSNVRQISTLLLAE